MTPEQFDIFLERNEKANAAAIEKYVNGGIRDLRKLVEEHNTKHEADMVEVREHIAVTKPIIEAYTTGKNSITFIKWISGIVVTVAAAWALFFKN